jgi:hypothetical protein
MAKLEYFKLRELWVEGNGFCKQNYYDTIVED